MTPTPTVSILVTARNNEAHVVTTLRSALRQTLGSLELLVADDGSEDSTAAAVQSIHDPRLRLTRFETSAGVPVRRNELLEQAAGRYVAPLDADDVWFPERLALHVRLLESRPELVAAGSDVLVIDGESGPGGYFRLPRSGTAIRWCCLFTSPVIHSAATIRASAFRDGVRYDPAYPLAQDYDLWTKLLRRGDAVNLARPLTLYRVHAGQATRRREAEQRAEQEEIGLRAIGDVHAGMSGDRARLAWRLGAGAPLAREELEAAIGAYRELFDRFTGAHRRERGLAEARRIAATALLRRAGLGRDAPAWTLRRAGLAIDPLASVSAAAVRAANLAAARRHRRRAGTLLEELART